MPCHVFHGVTSEKIGWNIKTISMPRKIRELKAQIASEGFVYLPKLCLSIYRSVARVAINGGGILCLEKA